MSSTVCPDPGSVTERRSAHVPMCVPIGSHADIVIARQQGRALAAALQFLTTDSAFVATTAAELARALLAHTVRGEIRLQRVHEDGRSGVAIVARDPFAPQVRMNGHVSGDLVLPALRRLVDEFDMTADGARGAITRAVKWCRRR